MACCLTFLLTASLAGCTVDVSERSLLHPTAGGALDPRALAQAAPAYALTEHWIQAADGARLSAVLLRQPGARTTILYFGGNGFTMPLKPSPSRGGRVAGQPPFMPALIIGSARAKSKNAKEAASCANFFPCSPPRC